MGSVQWCATVLILHVDIVSTVEAVGELFLYAIRVAQTRASEPLM